MSAGAKPPIDVGAALRSLIAAVAPAEQPLFLAIAERMAADRYRRWADEIGDATARTRLLAGAAREDESASRVEAVFPDAAAIQSRLRATHPTLTAVTAEIFDGRPLVEQFAIQATGERLGAQTWRAFAAAWPDEGVRAAFLACAPLEEASAEVLESLR